MDPFLLGVDDGGALYGIGCCFHRPIAIYFHPTIPPTKFPSCEVLSFQRKKPRLASLASHTVGRPSQSRRVYDTDVNGVRIRTYGLWPARLVYDEPRCTIGGRSEFQTRDASSRPESSIAHPVQIGGSSSQNHQSSDVHHNLYRMSQHMSRHTPRTLERRKLPTTLCQGMTSML